MRRRSLSILGKVLFIFYCAAVGVYLLLQPWTGELAPSGLAASGFFRGFISGLGLLHLAAGAADFKTLSRELHAESPP